MLIPGGNLLNQAFRLIGRQSFKYYKFKSRTPNTIGQDVTSYHPATLIQGSVQPVPRKLIEEYGLDLQANYLLFYISLDMLDVARGVAGDQIVFNNRTFNCLSETDWFPMDGWTAILAVQVPAAQQC